MNVGYFTLNYTNSGGELGNNGKIIKKGNTLSLLAGSGGEFH